jgi:regulator of protease activity HflC (stomatin/prohibitin superfamily)
MFDGNFTTSSSTSANTSPKKAKIKLGKNFVYIVAAVILLIILLRAAIYVVPAGNVGVITRWGAVNRSSLAGIHVKIPFAENVILMSTRTQKDESPATAMSNNLQVVTSLIAVNYRLDGNKALQVYQEIGPDYAEIVVAPAIQNAFKAATARFTAEELITKRGEVRQMAEDELIAQIEPYHIIVENFNIINMDFSEEYQNAIESKQVAQQQVETSKQKLAQAEIDAQTVIAQAQGQADAQKALKDTGALTPEYLQYLFLTKWNGILPQVMTSGSGMMLDISQFMQGPEKP